MAAILVNLDHSLLIQQTTLLRHHGSQELLTKHFKKSVNLYNFWPILVTSSCLSGLCLVPKHEGGWQIMYQLLAPALHSINGYIDPNSFL